MEKGIIERYYPHKKYGFIKADSDKIVVGLIRFDCESARWIVPGKKFPMFAGAKELTGIPEKGDAVYFEYVMREPHKPEATEWGYAAYYKTAEALGKSKVMYRVMTYAACRKTGKSWKPVKKWGDGSLFELCMAFPRPYNGYEKDELAHTKICGEFFEITYFLKKIGKRWEQCTDPRPEGGFNIEILK